MRLLHAGHRFWAFPRVPPTIVPTSLPRHGDPAAAVAQDRFLSAKANGEIVAIVRHGGAGWAAAAKPIQAAARPAAVAAQQRAIHEISTPAAVTRDYYASVQAPLQRWEQGRVKP